MIEYLIDDFVIWAYRNKLLKDYKKRDIYEYAIQVILYNALSLVIIFLVSIFTHNIQSFIMFIIFFVMLRRNLGGFHFKNKYACMTVSISMYLAVMFSGCKIYQLSEDRMLLAWLLMSIFCLFMPALKDKNYNKKIVNIMIIADMILIFMGVYLKIKSVAWAVIFNICVLFMFILQKLIEFLKLSVNEEK